MIKFNPGDKVRRIGGNNYNNMVKGNIYTVNYQDGSDLYLENISNPFLTSNFELFYFNTNQNIVVGSKVKRIKGNEIVLQLGTICTVTHIDEPDRDGDIFINIKEFGGTFNIVNFELVVEENKIQTNEVQKMNPVETKLEKDALESAKKESIENEIRKKAVEYKRAFEEWMSYERQAREYRKKADELATLLQITTAEKENVF